MMNNIIIILIAIMFGMFLAGIVVYLLLNYNRKKQQDEKNDSSLNLILQQMNEISRVMDNKLCETRKEMHDTLHFHANESSKIIREITEELTRVNEGQKQVIGFADQLQSLEKVLRNPKQRGILGEYYLETVLKNVLPPGSYQMQYQFPDKTIVDAVVFVKDKIIPIDAKFSLENYNRISEMNNETERERLEKKFESDLKNRIIETSKYIQPAHGTTDFAFMFIPHEAIYYDLLINKIGQIKDENNNNLIQQSVSKYKVIIVSPTSFLAYLQTVLQGLRALKIEESAQEIGKRVQILGKHLNAYYQFHVKLGNTLNTAINHYDASEKELKKLNKDILSITKEETALLE